MNLAQEYQRQFGLRDWGRLLEALPDIAGRRVLDLGCGIGDLANALAARGAQVTGIESNSELLEFARARQMQNVEFRCQDLRDEFQQGAEVDGVWCSFVAAYFLDLQAALKMWTKELKPGGWIALTEIDDMFAHQPLSARTASLFSAYCDEALQKGRYDFRAGRKLAENLRQAGFSMTKNFDVTDREFCFAGPAGADALESWRLRFSRMKVLEEFLGVAFPEVRDEFLACLMRDDHVSQARVCFCLATRMTAEIRGLSPV